MINSCPRVKVVEIKSDAILQVILDEGALWSVQLVCGRMI